MEIQYIRYKETFYNCSALGNQYLVCPHLFCNITLLDKLEQSKIVLHAVFTTLAVCLASVMLKNEATVIQNPFQMVLHV